MSSKVKVIRLLDCTGRFLNYCTRERAKNIIKEHKGYFVADRTIKLKPKKSIESKIKRQVIKDSKRICYICNKIITQDELATIDHVIPRSRDNNAKNNKFNMKCCCEHCNNDKANMTLSEYIKYIRKNRNKYLYISDKRLEYLEKYANSFEDEYYNSYSMH